MGNQISSAKCFVTLVVAACAFTATASQTWYVDAINGDDANEGVSWGAAIKSIQHAIDVSSAFDEIVVGDGTYGPISVTNTVAIRSVNGPSKTQIDANGRGRCATLGTNTNYEVFLSGFTMKNGYEETSFGGGSIGGTISNCIYAANKAAQGGAAYGGRIYDSFLYENATINHESYQSGAGAGGATYRADLYGCIVSNNVAYYGGGACHGTISNSVVVCNIAKQSGGGILNGRAYDCILASNLAAYGGGASSIVAYNCIISNNYARLNGDVYYADGGGAGSCDLNNCRVVGNRSDSYGGGLSSGTFSGCWIEGNYAADSGGGVYICDGTNSVIVANVAGRDGGGSSESSLVNCTVVDNSANQYGGGVSGGRIINSIVYENSAMMSNDVYQSEASHSCSSNISTNDGNIILSPLFLDFAKRNFHLRTNSPCINTGLNSDLSLNSTDYDGNMRIKDGRIDMGAYEHDIDGVVGIYVIEPQGGFVSPMSGTVMSSGSVFFTAYGVRPFIGFYTNGVFATSKEIFEWTDITESGILEARFDTTNPLQIYVNGSYGDDENVGISQDAPLRSIDAALKIAYDGDTIMVDDGVYPPISVPNRPICIKSINGPSSTIIDGNGLSRCATLIEEGSSGSTEILEWGETGGKQVDQVLTSTNTVLSGFTLRNGLAAPWVFDDFYGPVGGGVCGGTLKNCIIRENYSYYGGGGAYCSYLENCTIVSNASMEGGGASECILDRCMISDNHATDLGGGLCAAQANNCIIMRNDAEQGGGIWHSGLFQRRAGLINCTIVNNHASQTAGGISQVICKNCIISGNTASNNTSSDSSCQLTHCCTDFAMEGDGNILSDPCFVDIGCGNYRLREDSPCIDAGEDSFLLPNMESDIYGSVRIQGMHVDIGAVECQPVNSFDGNDSFDHIWGTWSMENDVEFEFPESFSDWDVIMRFAWRARDKFVTSSEIGCMPPSERHIVISLGSFAFAGQMVAMSGEEVPMDEELGVKVWHVRVSEDVESGIFRATVGDVEVNQSVLPSYNADKWIEAVYGSPPAWLNADELSEWYVRRSRARLELFMTLVPMAYYSDYVDNLNQEEESVAHVMSDKLLIRGFNANASKSHFHILNVRTPTDAIVNVLGSTDLSGTNWTFCGVGSFARGYSSAGLESDARTYFVSLAEGEGDTDGDGISDILETMVYGTNPYKADTSGGGLKDGEKIFRYELNPLVCDTSGDGIDDDERILSGADPRIAISPAEQNTARRAIRYYYDDEDRLIRIYIGTGGASATTTFSPAGNATIIKNRSVRNYDE